MKLIKASYEILEPYLASLRLYQRIEHCGRICYKSESKISNGSDASFCAKMLDNGHKAVLEMARLHLIVYCEDSIKISNAQISNKFLQITTGDNPYEYIVSGSPRAFIEAIGTLAMVCRDFLNLDYPLLFKSADHLNNNTHGITIRYAYDNEIPYEHKYIAVKLIVNRAVSHEIVRHRPCSFLQESQRYCRYSNDKFGNEVTFIIPRVFFGWTITDIFNGDAPLNIWTAQMESAEKAYLKLLDQGYSPQAARTVLPNSCKTEIIIYASTTEWEHIFSLRVPRSAEPSMREVTIPLQYDMFDAGYIRKTTWPSPEDCLR